MDFKEYQMQIQINSGITTDGKLASIQNNHGVFGVLMGF